MPPNQSRSAAILRMAFINCCGLVVSRSSPMSFWACGESLISLRLREKARPLREAFLRIGRRVDEDVAVIEGCHQPDGALAQHAVAEHVARHVADAYDRERPLADVHVHFTEMPLDRFPGAARRNAHLFVVVAGRAA